MDDKELGHSPAKDRLGPSNEGPRRPAVDATAVGAEASSFMHGCAHVNAYTCTRSRARGAGRGACGATRVRRRHPGRGSTEAPAGYTDGTATDGVGPPRTARPPRRDPSYRPAPRTASGATADPQNVTRL